MDTRTLTTVAENYIENIYYNVDQDGATVTGWMSRHDAEEIARRWNTHNALVEALADMVTTASEVEGMMDGDKDKQEAWTEELGRLYVAIDEARQALEVAKAQ